jgi:hypothetical protein
MNANVDPSIHAFGVIIDQPRAVGTVEAEIERNARLQAWMDHIRSQPVVWTV